MTWKKRMRKRTKKTKSPSDRSCTVDSLVWVPNSVLGLRRLDNITRELTVQPSSMGNEDSDPICLVSRGVGRIGVPVHYGYSLLADLGVSVIDNRTNGKACFFSQLPEPRDSEQDAFFRTLLAATESSPAILGVAPTGSGKTVAALYVTGKLRKSTLVIVPSKNLARQWKKEAQRFLGMSSEAVHIFDEGKCEWKGRRLVIAVIHNLVRKTWPSAFYRHFGLVVWDEVHRLGARSFSKTLMQFPARYRLGLTATPDRRDGATPIVTHSFGEPDNSLEGNTIQTMPCGVYVVQVGFKFKYWSGGSPVQTRSAMISALADCKPRNVLICRIIWRAWSRGRTILVLSDRISQLQMIGYILSDLGGIPAKDIGLFVGSDHDGARTSQEELARIKSKSKIVLATYGMFKEGQNIPRLDFGIDATPRAEGEQVLGRIRRRLAGKPVPIWVTLIDGNNKILKNTASARVKDYCKCGASVKNIGSDITRLVYERKKKNKT